MEIILEMLDERRKIRVEWKQIIYAVLLALLCAGLYSYTDAYPGYTEEKIGERQAALVEHTTVPNPFIELPLLPEESEKHKKRTDRDAVSELMDAAVSRDGYFDLGSEVKNEVESGKKVENMINRTKQVSEEAPDILLPDIAAEMPVITIKNPDVAVEVPGDMAEDPNVITDKDEAEDRPQAEENEDADKTEPEPPAVLERFPGFLANDKGYITGYTDASKFMKDHLVVFPVHGACTGIEKNALKGLEKEVYEIYIPANIFYIADGAFDDLRNLCYIEAAAGNREFYSKNGILYHRDGSVAACPERMKK